MSDTKREGIRGFKVFNFNWTCINKQYTCPGVFEEDVDIHLCGPGMHFCQDITKCFNYYNFDPKNHVAEVIAYGDVITVGDKSCTDKLEIVRELSWEEVLSRVNVGNYNTGKGNTGDSNNGNYNTGGRNSGSCNTGYDNTGSRNAGHENSGDYNTGDCNRGCYNCGDNNMGFCNTGNHNLGSHNVGNHNIGNYNVGDFNLTDCHSGCFNTMEEPTIMLFNKPSDWTYTDWNDSKAAYILSRIPQEPQKWWDYLSDEKKDIIKAIPNFDAEIFFKCTGIKVN